MFYENRSGAVWSTVHPELNWTEESDTRLVPILPLITDFHSTLYVDDVFSAASKLQRIGDLLIPHTQNLETPISIGDFIQTSTTAEVKKGQYWSYVVKILNEDGVANETFLVQKTGVWNSSGVRLRVDIQEENRHLMTISLARLQGCATVSANLADKNILVPFMQFSKSTWRNTKWKGLLP